MENRILYASIKPTKDILGLYNKAKELDADGLGNAEVLERAEAYLVENESKLDFGKLSKTRLVQEYTGDLPSSFKVRVNNSKLHMKAIDVIKRKFNIRRVMTPFFMRIALTAYICHLENETKVWVTKKKSCQEVDIDGLRIKAISLILQVNDDVQLKELIQTLQWFSEKDGKL